jgi:hypothetical protein
MKSVVSGYDMTPVPLRLIRRSRVVLSRTKPEAVQLPLIPEEEGDPNFQFSIFPRFPREDVQCFVKTKEIEAFDAGNGGY